MYVCTLVMIIMVCIHMCVHIGWPMRETQSQSLVYLKSSNKFKYNTVHIIMTKNRIVNKYRTLTKGLEVVGFENATLHHNVATYSFNNRLSSFNRLDISALDNLCKDLKEMVWRWWKRPWFWPATRGIT